jgi:hypothetical protein
VTPERFRGALGWAGVTVVAGALVLTVPRFSDFQAATESVSQDLSPLVWCAFLLAVGVLIFTGTRSSSDTGTDRLGVGDVLVRGATALAGLALVWFAFPARHLGVAVVNDGYRMFPGQVTDLWIGVCAITLGSALVLCSTRSSSWRRWGRTLVGVVAGGVALALIVGLTPAVRHTLMVEHTVADAAGEPAPVPATVSRMGWSWQPQHPVMGVERGPRGPIVRYADGFVALDGATGEELWTYQRPHARQVETGLFAGSSEYAYLLHVAEPEPEVEAETQTMVVLDAATGELVRDAPMPPLADEDAPDIRYLTPRVRVSAAHEEGEQLVVAHSTDSTERVWEFALDETREGRLCLWVPNRGIRGYADRVLIARLCLDEPEASSTEELRDILDRMAVPDDAVESVIALDAATGEQVWRHDWTPDDLIPSELPTVSDVLGGSEGTPVAVTSGGTFSLVDGEPIAAVPETLDGRTLAMDTSGAVVAHALTDDETGTILRTGPEGTVIHRTQVDRDMDFWWDMDSASVLDSAILVPYTSHGADDRVTRELAIVSTDGEQSAWERVDFDDELVPELTEAWQSLVEHRTLVVPGAVVSYIDDPNEPGRDPEPLYGLVA